MPAVGAAGPSQVILPLPEKKLFLQLPKQTMAE
jgi:hypothetical protein